ncbi:hypothetical protein HY500_04135 [Candidatus Woesearchaeota archaeon]|nr:hypothetical protein [Candidatus Woesearchaeota archaeon]
MKRKEYIIWDYKKLKKSEKTIRKFLLKNSDTLRLTEHHWVHIKFFKLKRHGGEKDDRFVSILEKLKQHFIKKVTSDKKFNDLKQPGNFKFNHYFYKLSPKLKSLLNEETLLWHHCFESKNFYGFEDPTFYNKKNMLACIVTHEPYIILYLTEQEKKSLEKQGVLFN